MVVLSSKENQVKILQEFLKLCSFEGWNNKTLALALKNCGFKANYQEIIFENGCFDLIDLYIEEQNKITAQKYKNIDPEKNTKIREKITNLLYINFETQKNNKVVLQTLSNFIANPKNLATPTSGIKPLSYSLKICYKIADFMWYEIGDKSSDFNFYTKRATLAKIILKTFIVFMKDDDSLIKTKQTIDKEIAKVMKFESYKYNVKKFINNNLFDDSKNLKRIPDILKNLPFIRLRNTTKS